MDKKLRKKLSEQIGAAIALLLRNSDPDVSLKMEKHIRSSAKDIAKKFFKTKNEIAEKAEKKAEELKKSAAPLKKAGRKVARKVVKKVAATRKAIKG